MIGVLAGGIIVGALATATLFKVRLRSRRSTTDRLVTETIGQYAYLRATVETVDQETESEIQERAEEIAAEYDVTLADVGGEIDG